jgi:hypothetical protein
VTKDDEEKRVRTVVTGAVAASHTLEDFWRLFSAAAFQPGTPAIQRREMRRAFFAGASVMLETFRRIGEPGFEEEAGVKRLHALADELDRFAQDLKHGRA